MYTLYFDEGVLVALVAKADKPITVEVASDRLSHHLYILARCKFRPEKRRKAIFVDFRPKVTNQNRILRATNASKR